MKRSILRTIALSLAALMVFTTVVAAVPDNLYAAQNSDLHNARAEAGNPQVSRAIGITPAATSSPGCFNLQLSARKQWF
ncbi:MAG: hypothetical protein FWC70_07990 [Defluviitaleaceae bacterium]|nr:hypothetical protein [Defluviitaleaceae bacterium]